MLHVKAGVPGGPIVSRVTNEVEVVGLNFTRDSYEWTGRNRKSVSWGSSMQIDKLKKLDGGNSEFFAR